jgi:uncharacterized protein (DUF2062 family)
MQTPLQDEDHVSLSQPEGGLSPVGRLRRFADYLYDRFFRLHGSPEQIAWGAAVGFFVAMSPTIGFQTCLAVPIAAFFKVSKVAAAATVWLTNPVTAPFIYGFNYMIGAKLLGYPLNAALFSSPSRATFWHGSAEVLLSLIVGGALIGIVVSVTGYFVTLWMVRTAREKSRRIRRKWEQ